MTGFWSVVRRFSSWTPRAMAGEASGRDRSSRPEAASIASRAPRRRAACDSIAKVRRCPHRTPDLTSRPNRRSHRSGSRPWHGSCSSSTSRRRRIGSRGSRGARDGLAWSPASQVVYGGDDPRSEELRPEAIDDHPAVNGFSGRVSHTASSRRPLPFGSGRGCRAVPAGLNTRAVRSGRSGRSRRDSVRTHRPVSLGRSRPQSSCGP